MSIELTLARRLALRDPGKRRGSTAVWVAVAGVALSVVVMLLSIAVMLGFKGEVTRRILALDDSVTITGYTPDSKPGAAFLPSEVLDNVTLPEGAVVTLHISLPAILKTPDDFLGVSLGSREDVADSLVVLSRAQAAKLRLKEGDKIAAYFFIDGRLRTRALHVAEPYHTDFAEHDEAIAYCSPALPRQLLGLPEGSVQSLGISGLEFDAIEQTATSVYSELLTAFYEGKLTAAYGISTIFQTEGSFFSWLDLLDTNVVVILVLMGLVAAFTLVSSLFIIILERVKTIGLLKALGATNGQIRRVFMLMAERLVLRGLLIGNIVGLGLIFLQDKTHLVPLDPVGYYVDFVPVSINAGAVILLNLGALLLSWLIFILPALIVSRISPATTMRYE